MATQKAISGNPVVNNGSRLLHAGNSTRPEVGSINYGKVGMSVTGQTDVSGLTHKAISGGDFNVDNRLVSMRTTTGVAGTEIKVIKSGSGLQDRQSIKSYNGYTRSDIDYYDKFTGLAEYGANAGDYVLASGIDGKVGKEADKAANPTMQVPGRLVYQFGSNSPKQQSYSKWTG